MKVRFLRSDRTPRAPQIPPVRPRALVYSALQVCLVLVLAAILIGYLLRS